jgi:ABC-type sulfate transport system substrate-binding protein
MTQRRNFIKIPLAAAAAAALALPGVTAFAQPNAPVTLLNVSYDPTRELYVEYNAAFAQTLEGQDRPGRDHQAKPRGLGPPGAFGHRRAGGRRGHPVLTLALAGDIDPVRKNGAWIPPGDINVITPNPKTSGGARWNYLAAWEFAKRKYGGDAKANEFVQKLYANVSILDTGARGSSVTFAQRNQGDVFISWDNEAYLLEKEFGNKVDFVYPSLSILAEPPVNVVDKNVDKKGTRAIAEEYLKYLYTEEAQDLIGKHFYRPTGAKAQAKYAKQLPKLNLFTIEQAFGGWAKADKDHFADGGSFDQIYAKK